MTAPYDHGDCLRGCIIGDPTCPTLARQPILGTYPSGATYDACGAPHPRSGSLPCTRTFGHDSPVHINRDGNEWTDA